jgi:hypothetical protein
MGISHQTEGGKPGVNPALSRSCNETYTSKSECPPKLTNKPMHICEVQVNIAINISTIYQFANLIVSELHYRPLMSIKV